MITINLNLSSGRTIEVSIERDEAESLSGQIQDQLDDIDEEVEETPDFRQKRHPYICAAISAFGIINMWGATQPFKFDDFLFGLTLLIGGGVAFARTFNKGPPKHLYLKFHL